MVIVLASLLVLVAGWWIAMQFPPIYSVGNRPAVEVKEVPPPVPIDQPDTRAYTEPQPEKIYDWSEPEKDSKTPVYKPENKAKEPERTVLVYGKPSLESEARPEPEVKANSQPKTSMVMPNKDADEQTVPPPVRIRPEAPAESEIVRGGKIWKSPAHTTVSSDEVSLTPSGETIGGHEVYTLSGEPDPTVLFLETSPGSGQYEVYRPAG
jgi:hypothetical protein